MKENARFYRKKFFELFGVIDLAWNAKEKRTICKKVYNFVDFIVSFNSFAPYAFSNGKLEKHETRKEMNKNKIVDLLGFMDCYFRSI